MFIGASAAEAGGLRATSDDPLTASVAIEARAARQILDNFAPIGDRPSARLGAGGGARRGADRAGDLRAGAARLHRRDDRARRAVRRRDLGRRPPRGCLIRSRSSAPALAGFAAAAAVMGASARRRAKALRARFERHLAPQVIQRIIANEDQPKLSGERREITALFTDIEGFTGMVGRAQPEALVAALDAYFEGVVRVGLAHGGMIDKFVGDAVHVFFNMPFDLADHATQALDCAIEIVSWTEAYRREPGPAALGFGRTRVGLESGPALVGDVGGGAKLDYTAHGETVNAAARLEQANKVTGSAICVGPGAAARIAPRPAAPGRRCSSCAVSRARSAPPRPGRRRLRRRGGRAISRPMRGAKPSPARRASFAALAAEIDDPVAGRLAGG